ERPEGAAHGRGAAPDAGALTEQVGVLGQGGVVPLGDQPGQHLARTPDRHPPASRRLRPTSALGAGRPEPARERPLADPEAPRDLGLAALTSLVGGEHTLAKVRGAGVRHRRPPAWSIQPERLTAEKVPPTPAPPAVRQKPRP